MIDEEGSNGEAKLPKIKPYEKRSDNPYLKVIEPELD